MNIAHNLHRLREVIPEHITIVAVSKTKPVSAIMEAYEAGHRDFGENYVQELVDKQPQLPDDIRWHFIGHLQTNKVKMIAPFVHLIHGVDSAKLLKEINKQASRANRTVHCLLQLHVAQEETKYGLSFEECDQILSDPEVADYANTTIRGFMCMGSNTEDEEVVRQEFRSVNAFRQKMAEKHGGLTVLSMGMSNDYVVAIEEGSNMVRIGSSIFGVR
jgi:PLP dependent protein